MRLAGRGLVALAIGCVVLSGSGTASAHSGVTSYVYLEIFQTEITGRIEFPVEDLNDVLGLAIPQEEADAAPIIEANLSLIQEYADEHLSLGVDGERWPLRFDGYSFFEIPDPGSYVIVDFVVDRPFEATPREFDVTYDAITHAMPQRDALLLIGTDWGSGTFNNESSHLLRFTDDDPTKRVELGDHSFWRGVTGVVGLGVDHIRIGTDHILFVIALVLPAVLIFSRREGWEPAPSFGSSLWRVLKIVTMFTVAHTITLLLGGLGVIEVPPAPVETIIALSIAAAALHNIRPVLANKEWLLAFGFGLFHGFGFAGLLSDLGLTQDRRFISLLGFNLGIELGQAVIVLLVFPSLFILRRSRYYVPAMKWASGGLAVLATIWAIERAFQLDFNVTLLVDIVVLWPRSAILVAALALVAVVFAIRERRHRSPSLQPSLTGLPEDEG